MKRFFRLVRSVLFLFFLFIIGFFIIKKSSVYKEYEQREKEEKLQAEQAEQEKAYLCSFCRKLFEYGDAPWKYHEEREMLEVFLCPECDKLPKCSLCELPAEVDCHGIRFCRYCEDRHKITTQAEAQKKLEEICQVLASKFGMKFKNTINLELVPPRDWCDGLCSYPNITIDNDLLCSCFHKTVAHELGHAWYHEMGFDLSIKEDAVDNPRCPGIGVSPVSEGFAEFVSWRYMEEYEKMLKANIDQIPAGHRRFLKSKLLNGLKVYLEESFYESIDMDDESFRKKMEKEESFHRVYREGFRRVHAVMGDAKTAPEWKKILEKEYVNRHKRLF